MRPILLAGPAGSGKDQAAQFLAQQFSLSVHRLAQPLYDLSLTSTWQDAQHLLSHDHSMRQAETRRLFLQGIGDLYRSFSPTLLVTLLVNRAAQETPAVVVPDVRLPEEFHGFRRYWPEALLIYCDVPAAARQERLKARDTAELSSRAREHVTEVAVLGLKRWANILWDNGDDWPRASRRLLGQVLGLVNPIS